MNRFVFWMAWRESRSSLGRLSLFAACIACGVAALVATQTVGTNLESAVRSNARVLVGGDHEIVSRALLPAPILERVALANGDGIAVAQVVEMLSMVSTPGTTTTRVAELKAVESGYPLYGKLVTEPGTAASTLHQSGGVLVSEALLIQLETRVGAKVRIGEADFVIRGILRTEPDRIGDGFRVGPRVLLRRADLESTRLIRSGTRLRHRVLLRGTAGTPLYMLRRRFLTDAVIRPDQAGSVDTWEESGRRGGGASFADGADRPRARSVDSVEIRTAAEGQPGLNRFLERVTVFLDLVGLSIVFLASIGISLAVRTLMQQRMDTVAILKCVGASSGRLVSVYLIQALGMAAVGTLLGCLVGSLLPGTLAQALAGVLPFEVPMPVRGEVIMLAATLGLSLTVAFAALPVLAARHVPPARLLLRSLDTTVGAGFDGVVWLTRAGLLAGCIGLVLWRSGTREVAFYYLGGLGSTLLLLGLAARVVVLVAQRLAQVGPFVVRHGLSNLRRPGNQSATVVVALGLGIFLVALVDRLQGVLQDELLFGLSSATPNVFVIDVQDDQRASVTRIMARLGLKPLDEAPLVRSRISHIKDRPLVQLYPDLDKAPWWVGREYVLTYRDRLTAAETLAEGRLWAPGGDAAEVSLEMSTAVRLGLRMGDWITLDIQGELRRVQVTSLRAVRWSSMRPNFFMVLPPLQLESMARTWFMVTRVDDAAKRTMLQRDLIRAHSNLTVLDLTLGLAILREFMTRLSWVVRLTAGFCVLGGLLVMAASILMTRRHRSYECAVLKAQGASRSTLLRLLAVEYGVLGAVAGLVGSAAATLGAATLGRQLFDLSIRIDPVLVIVATMAGGVASALTGALSSRGVLERPALEILRDP